MALTAIQEDYLETIYRLSRDRVAVRTTDVAERLGCRLPTVTRTVRKIVQAGFVVRRFTLAHQLPGLQPQQLQDLFQPFARRWMFEILDDLGLQTPLLEQCEGLPRLGTAWIVVDRDAHAMPADEWGWYSSA